MLSVRPILCLSPVALLACGALLELDEFAGASGGAGGSTSSSTSGSGGTGAAGGAGGTGGGGTTGGAGGSDGGTCNLTMEGEMPTADTALVQGACGSISYGASEVLNIGVGAALVEFTLSPAAATALIEGRVESLQLTLERVPNHSECAGQCPQAAGAVLVNPLRTDWIEGDGTAYAGADWCRRTSGNPGESWGANGASAPNEDIWSQSGEAAFDATQPTVTIFLNPAAHVPALFDAQLGVRLSLDDGDWVMGSREYQSNVAQLTVSYCP